jgi:plastocyanin
MSRKLLATAVCIGALLVSVACSSTGTTNSPSSATSGTPASSSTVVPTVGTGGAAPTSLAARPGSPVASPSPVVAGAQSVNVNMTDANLFQPATLTIPRGTTVTWTNTGQVGHTVTDDPSKAANPSDSVLPSGAQAWDSGTVNGGGTFSHTFDTPGQYVYFCIPHEALGMIGRITVTG